MPGNPNPRTAHLGPYQWKPGQSGNPAGAAKHKKITGRLIKMIEEKGLDSILAKVWVGAALGDDRILQGRKPSYAFFRELLDRIEGRVPGDEGDVDSLLADLVGEAEARAEERKRDRHTRKPGADD